jgi:hypothetical protein
MDQEHKRTDQEMETENEFLKMKLMLEKGAEFGTCADGKDLPPGIENEFLKHIMEFEKQWEDAPMIKIYDKVGRPTEFKPVEAIDEENIGTAWQELSAYLREHGISLDACSPNITRRELYRFATQELFELEVEDIQIPGLMHGFIYDEFHPDPVYDNTCLAVDECMKLIFQEAPLEWTFQFSDKGIRLNTKESLTAEALKDIINRFKTVYDRIELAGLNCSGCSVMDTYSIVQGTYAADVYNGPEKYRMEGKWEVRLEKDMDFEAWLIVDIQIEGINF